MQHIQPWRSTVTGETPASGLPPGAVWSNAADLQFGLSKGGDAAALIGIRNFSEDAAYAIGDLIAYGGDLLRAGEIISPGIFDAAQWEIASITFLEILAGGVGWDFTASYSGDDVSLVTYSKGELRYRETPTYDGFDVTDILYEYSSDGGQIYDAVAALEVAYDDDGSVLTGTWS